LSNDSLIMAKASLPSNAPASYEAAVQELEQLVARMESGQLALDDMLGAYQRGAVLLAYCRERLTAVENQVRMLEDGESKPGSAA
jgi:exodeoxyribonuclease VII small subunit